MRIRKTTDTTPRSSEAVNIFSNSTKDSYACDYSNNTFKTKGITLWTNPNPTSAFESQTITLSTSNWDYCEIIYKNYIDGDTFEVHKVYKNYMPSEVGGTFYYNNFLYTGTRKITLQQSGLGLNFAYANGIKIGDTVIAADTKWIVPIKIIGYKE